LIGIVQKNGIMLVDFALEVEAEPRIDVGTIDSPGLFAAVSPGRLHYLILFTTPVVYLYLDRLNAFVKRHGRERSRKDAALSHVK
jgi:hypothetical protein